MDKPSIANQQKPQKGIVVSYQKTKINTNYLFLISQKQNLKNNFFPTPIRLVDPLHCCF